MAILNNATILLLIVLLFLQKNGSEVTGFAVENCLPSTTTMTTPPVLRRKQQHQQSSKVFGSLAPFASSLSSKPISTASRYYGRQQSLVHYHHPESVCIDEEEGSTAINEFSRVGNRLRGIFRRNSKMTLNQYENNNNKSFKRSRNKKNKRSYRRMWLAFASIAVSFLVRPTVALAMGAMGGSSSGAATAPLPRKEQLSLLGLFGSLFVALALLHAAEIAITTLYPWKVKEFAEEEEKLGKRGTFKILNEDITRVLTTILVASTTCSIFATTVFTHLVAGSFGASGEKYGALALTFLTLFFVELLPKSIGVTNAESVARIMTPPINIITTVVSPLGMSLSWLAKKTLSLIGLKDKDNASITDSQLRLIVTGARDSGTIDLGEQEMIQGVLGLQNQRVKEIMKPRVEIIAVPKEMSVASVLGVVRESGYSRIPVYDGEIDNIVGIVLAKNVLDFFVNGVLVDEDVIRKIRENSGTNNKDSSVKEEAEEKEGDVRLSTALSEQSSSSSLSSSSMSSEQVTQLYTTENMPTVQTPKGKENYVKPLTGLELARRMEKSISTAELIESCYFVPETANGWSVLQEMRRRRVHMAIVVDEYGGTEGLVSLEDIVEEVVGEIYDEDDEEEYDFSEDSITLQDDGSFIIRGDADLGDCDTILDLNLDEEEALKVFATLSGFLCMCAGEIPQVGDFVMSRGWCFEIMNADDKKILQVKVDRLVGAFEEGSNEATEDDDNPIRGFLKRNLGNDDEENNDNDDEEDASIAQNRETAREVERMVSSGNEKQMLKEIELADKK